MKLSDVNAFHLFHMDPKYFINVAMLESEYKRIQKLLHPDMFVNRPIEEREASMQTSSTINQAYQVSNSTTKPFYTLFIIILPTCYHCRY